MTVTVIAMAILLSVLLYKEKKLGRKSNIRRHENGRRLRNIGRRWKMLESFLKLFRNAVPSPAPAAEMTAQSKPEPVYPDPEMPGIPDSSRPLVKEINEYLRNINKRLEGDVLGQPIVIETEQIRDRHLPKLLRSYVEIPAQHRRDIFNNTGKSASVHLSESLEAILKRLREIDKDLSREHIDTFEDNARFVQRTYGRNDDPLF